MSVGDQLRLALRHHPAAVTIITAPGPVGLTVSSFGSVSMHPPLVGFWVGTSASAFAALTEATHFAVHLLHADHTDLADLFARTKADRFGGGTRWESDVDGVPHLLDAPVRLRCRTAHRVSIGDHVGVIGEPLEIEHRAETQPLLRFQGRYTSVA
ncbi:flavin reductase family protein [Kibdelosporangium phytohabitans]|uniref:Flavin reductase n=1 Tax=Kibdelosporangium phytohabitans TaxID=860235 RepID=A0A0N9I9P2_9PSEU|nr:flavin reductase family protein [Kibdelosporangium phytohabitans]ALG12731.1 flavin reductase [Kibdelosporangium phytohabitans]MBE1464402.1 flavin reductase (DIM6/NTAB) family NADH-FMN oxidoreductase RutF [Kibdelosporangium phytohabitans]